MATKPLSDAIPLHATAPLRLVRKELTETLKLQRTAYLAHPCPTFEERKADLLALRAFRQWTTVMHWSQAISEDYGHRSAHESLFAEIYSVIDGVKPHAQATASNG